MPVNLNVLLVAAEVQPLVKTGGLADVAAALSPALRAMSVDARLLMPAYRGVEKRLDANPVGHPFRPLVSSDKVTLLKGTLPDTGAPIYLVDCPSLYDRPGTPYANAQGQEHWDNALRFGVLSRVAAMFGSDEGFDGWRADIVHGHDWHAGLASAYLKFHEASTAASVYTIHNLAYQGNFDRKCRKALGIDSLAFHMDGLEFYGHLSFMKSGIYYSDEVTTVSPTYAREIQSEQHGCGMDGVLRHRSQYLAGILNGIDETIWDPASDPAIPVRYDASDIGGKAACKRGMQEWFGLPQDPDAPLLAMLGRMTAQKGWDVMLEAAPSFLDSGAQLALTGEGNAEYEAGIRLLRDRFSDRVGHYQGFSEEIAHLTIAGADALLIPSRFEPCGLIQMYAQRYGTLPIAHSTGGLSDTIMDASRAAVRDSPVTGFLFDRPAASSLAASVASAVAIYRDQPETWRSILRNAMRSDFGWSTAARHYAETYQNALDARRAERAIN